MPATKRILFIVTSVSKVPHKEVQIGFWLPEFADPYYILSPEYELVVASPEGGPTVPDPTSIAMSVDQAKEENSTNFLNDKKDVYQSTRKLSAFVGKVDEFDAVYVVGGHGPMFDLAFDADSQTILADFYEKGKIVAADCAGVGSLVNVKLSTGDNLVKDKNVTGLSRSEVEALGFVDVVPFILEEKLNAESGGRFSKAAELWAPHLARDGRLITGQNPASAALVGKAILDALA